MKTNVTATQMLRLHMIFGLYCWTGNGQTKWFWICLWLWDSKLDLMLMFKCAHKHNHDVINHWTLHCLHPLSTLQWVVQHTLQDPWPTMFWGSISHMPNVGVAWLRPSGLHAMILTSLGMKMTEMHSQERYKDSQCWSSRFAFASPQDLVEEEVWSQGPSWVVKNSTMNWQLNAHLIWSHDFQALGGVFPLSPWKSLVYHPAPI